MARPQPALGGSVGGLNQHGDVAIPGTPARGQVGKRARRTRGSPRVSFAGPGDEEEESYVLYCDPNFGGRLLEFGLRPLSISVIPNKSQRPMWCKLLIPHC